MSPSRRHPYQDQPVVAPPTELAADFRAAFGGAFDRPKEPRPFGAYKCAFSEADLVPWAAAGEGEARDFVTALLDVIQEVGGGVRPAPAALRFTVNTGTPARRGWLFSVRVTAPINADVKMTREDGTWQFLVERSSRPVTPRGRPAADWAPAPEPPDARPPGRVVDV